MSYALSGVLQQAVFAALSGDAALAALVGDAIFDAVPAGAVPPLYLRLGEEDVTDASDGSGGGSVHRFKIVIVSSAPGFADAKAVAGAVSDALLGAGLTLARGRVVSLQFERASAKFNSTAQARQIEMRFRARLQDG